jgi:hypothetical protein
MIEKMTKAGQTSVEYLLLVFAVIVLMTSIFDIIKRRVLPEKNPCPADDKSLGCQIQSTFNDLGTSGQFRYFTLRR